MNICAADSVNLRIKVSHSPFILSAALTVAALYHCVCGTWVLLLNSTRLCTALKVALLSGEWLRGVRGRSHLSPGLSEHTGQHLSYCSVFVCSLKKKESMGITWTLLDPETCCLKLPSLLKAPPPAVRAGSIFIRNCIV
jgi:hypothetical protein